MKKSRSLYYFLYQSVTFLYRMSYKSQLRNIEASLSKIQKNLYSSTSNFAHSLTTLNKKSSKSSLHDDRNQFKMQYKSTGFQHLKGQKLNKMKLNPNRKIQFFKQTEKELKKFRNNLGKENAFLQNCQDEIRELKYQKEAHNSRLAKQLDRSKANNNSLNKNNQFRYLMEPTGKLIENLSHRNQIYLTVMEKLSNDTKNNFNATVQLQKKLDEEKILQKIIELFKVLGKINIDTNEELLDFLRKESDEQEDVSIQTYQHKQSQ